MLPGKKYTPDDLPAHRLEAAMVHRRSAARDRLDDSRRGDVPPQPLSGIDVDHHRSAARAGEFRPVDGDRRAVGATEPHQPADPEPHAARAHRPGVQPLRARARAADHGGRDRADAAGHLAQRQRQPQPRRRQLVQRQLRIPGRPNGHAGHGAAGLAVRAGEPGGPRAAGGPDEPVPPGSARGGAGGGCSSTRRSCRSSGSATTASCRIRSQRICR